tara:strand:+ start:635 stop:766 length:132 start_codon:yes stop_codon:yes gene_type:complete
LTIKVSHLFVKKWGWSKLKKEFDEYFDEIIGTLQITKLEFYEK